VPYAPSVSSPSSDDLNYNHTKNYKVANYAIFYVLLLRPSLLGQTFLIRKAVGTGAIHKMLASQITGTLLEWASTAVITNRWQEKTTITHESIHDH
jgi:hypothetical protein